MKNTGKETTVALEVNFTPDAHPERIDFHHNTFGLMYFHVENGVATVDEKWNRLTDGSLKDDFDRWITTGDVYRSVQQLPFIESVRWPDG